MFGNIQRAVIITHSALFIAMISVFSWVSIPLPPVPVTLQTLAVLLTGAVMRRYAIVPLSLWLLLGALGLPVFHNGTSGIGVLLGPTGGYLFGFLPAAVITGICYEPKRKSIRMIGIGIATITIYLFGISWLTISTGMALPAAVMVGMVPFLPGDILKAASSYFIAARTERHGFGPL